ncbi:phosphopantetheinyl transferase [Anaeroplasma bactoclasticum]|jgi:phosphopantetheinyl transferase|uniref:Phosphopantetheinyl transferase n=1 Tax=Anaeroplasma bactoclasticum TaxID=2088 RepID=A0A397S7R2_9MOLU|nr:4'-phosphopantetheinyl transferase superfamily protein [Anaeroplasma bactoclasticum]RIA78354.1 phosphopantetheinyl transferase [Anaeroplasma bactoclasticum]
MKQYTVYYLSLSEIKFYRTYLLSQVSEERKKRVLAYLNEEDQLLSLGAGYFVHKYFNDDVKKTSSGKLVSPKGFFNISHCKNYVVFVISDNECGIDIEEKREVKESLINYAFSESDKELIKKPEDFFLMWTLKEAIAKAEGSGLSGEIKNIPVGTGLIEYKDNSYMVKFTTLADYYISVAVKTNKPFEIVLKEEIIK